MLEQRLERGCRIRWVPADQMHLTVRFIGQVPDAEVPVVLHALERPLLLEPFEVEFAGCGVFPKSGPPRVIWVGVSRGLEQLQAMHEEFNRRLSSLFVPRDDRPFSAHLTLARIKEIGSHAARQLRESVRDVQPHSVRCRVDAATVFRSELSPRGPRYARLLQVLLTPHR